RRSARADTRRALAATALSSATARRDLISHPRTKVTKENVMLDAPQVRQKQQTIYKLVPQEIAALQSLSQAVAKSGREPEMLELVKLRASQLNGCAFCMPMHATDARKLHMSEEKLQLLAAWHEAPVYSPRERAALAWTESLTLIAQER